MANPLVIGSVLEFGSKIINHFFPDKTLAAEKEAELLKLMAQGDFSIVLKQLEINAVEAASPKLWVSGWRPYFGWVGGTGFGYVVLLKPLLGWVSAIHGWPEPPEIDTEVLWIVVSGILGIGTLRTYEKKTGATK